MSFYIFLFVNCSLWVLGFIFGLPLQMSTCTLMFLASQGRSDPADHGSALMGLTNALKSTVEDVEKIRKENSYKKKVCNDCHKILELENNHPTRGQGTRDTLILKNSYE